MHHPTYRTWFPFILVGLTICLLLVVVAVTQRRGNDEPEGSVDVVEVVSAQEYQGTMNKVFTDFLTSHDADSAYYALLDTRVPSRYKETHLELVVILVMYREGNSEEALERYNGLQEQINWLP
ncbi:MAG: hypothetical protein ABIA47_01605 [bacterium]